MLSHTHMQRHLRPDGSQIAAVHTGMLEIDTEKDRSLSRFLAANGSDGHYPAERKMGAVCIRRPDHQTTQSDLAY